MRRKTAWVGIPLLLLLGTAASTAAQRGRYELSVVVDGETVPEHRLADRTYIEAIRGRSFSLRISNPGPERIAVAVSVDGRNVIDAQRTTALGATKWVLGPGEVIEVPGWQISGDTARRFFFTETRSSYAKWLGDTRNVGTIEAVFFREKRPPYVAMPSPAPYSPGAEERQTGAPGTGNSAGAAGFPSRRAPRPETTRTRSRPRPKGARGATERGRRAARPRPSASPPREPESGPTSR